MRTAGRFLGTCAGILCLASPALAGFESLETYLPAVGRVAGQGGAQFFTTMWATNLAAVSVSFTFNFLKQGQGNPSPASFTDTLAPGQTKVYENVVESRLGLTGQVGAARIVSTGEILVSERIYNLAAGDDLGKSEGLFFAGVPKSFSISPGQSASIQGINQGGSENFRYNFALVETGGGSPTVNVQLFDGNGTMLGQKAYTLQPYEQLQPNVTDLFPAVATTNARITATVTSGPGSALIAGAQLANLSQDSSGFEMSFRDGLLGGATGVTSLNGLTGALSVVPGNGVSITPSGSSITIAATGGGGALTLPYSSAASSPTGSVFTITNPAASPSAGANSAITGIDGAAPDFLNGLGPQSAGVVGESNQGVGILAAGSDYGIEGVGALAGVLGYSGVVSVPLPTYGVAGANSGTAGAGVFGTFGVDGPDPSKDSAGVEGTAADQYGVVGRSTTSDGVVGYTDSADTPSAIAGVLGLNTSSFNTGYLGLADYAVKGTSPHGNAVFGLSNAQSGAGIEGKNGLSGNEGFVGGSNYGVFGSSSNGPSIWGRTDLTGPGNFEPGVYGQTTGTGIGVYGDSSSAASNAYAMFGLGANAGVFQGSVTVTGHLTVGGIQRFVLPHPTDATKEIRLGSPEGPEQGTYFRGTARIQGGFARIPVPESFRAVSSPDGLTVVTTPVGSPAVLFVAKESLDEIVIQGSSDVEFHYVVNGVSKVGEAFQPIAENEHFVPRSANDVNFMRFADPGVLAILKENGILNS
ncbi:MAG: hypothetical protein ACRD16_17015, partial [Thermoanaerobaculia bacterium]